MIVQEACFSVRRQNVIHSIVSEFRWKYNCLFFMFHQMCVVNYTKSDKVPLNIKRRFTSMFLIVFNVTLSLLFRSHMYSMLMLVFYQLSSNWNFTEFWCLSYGWYKHADYVVWRRDFRK